MPIFGDKRNILTENKNPIKSMFDSIAWRYDFLNHFLSFGIDRRWRKRAINEIAKQKKNPLILDIATGTADMAIASMKIEPAAVKGIDISEKMLELGRKKIEKLGLSGKIELFQADSENIPFEEDTFDAIMVAFGVRNFTDPLRGLCEMKRVLRDEGMVLILEFSKPSRFPFRNIYNFYFRFIIPILGKAFSGDKKAYSYLPESVMKFPDNENFMRLMKNAGFTETRQKKLTGGVASIYTGMKKKIQ